MSGKTGDRSILKESKRTNSEEKEKFRKRKKSFGHSNLIFLPNLEGRGMKEVFFIKK